MTDPGRAPRVRSLGRPTLDTVAARAGVGRGTVSRVINGSPHVSVKAQTAVRQAIAELGYVPNRAARALVTRRTDAVALVICEPRGQPFGDPFLAAIVRGITSGLSETGMHMWLSIVRSSAERGRVERQLTEQHVDGVLLLSRDDADPLPTLLAQRGLPTVVNGRPAASPNRPGYVDIDDAAGARQAVEHLFGRGRRRVATIAGPSRTPPGAARLAGYRAAVRAAGAPPDDSLIVPGDFTEAGGAVAMTRLIESVPDLDAVFVAGDLMAFGALRVLRAAGRRVPDDVAVVGFGDASVARWADPPLTTVRRPVREMGRRMAGLLVARIGGAEPAVPDVLLDPYLVRRASG